MSTPLVIYSGEEIDEHHRVVTEVLAKTSPLHCYYCGYILLNCEIPADNTVTGKCSNSGCRRISVFIEFHGKLKLLTKKTLSKLRDEELWPYSRTDMLLRTIETKKIINHG
jgi:hypothetical protein